MATTRRRSRAGGWTPIRVLAIMLACLAVALLVPGTASADAIDQWNALVDQANTLVDKVNALDAQIAASWDELNAIDPESANATAALPLLAGMNGHLAQMKADSLSAAGLWSQAAALDLSDEHRIYADQQAEVWQLNTEYCATTGQYLAKLETAYGEWATLSETQRDQLRQEADALGTRLDDLDAQITTMQEASDKYYEARSLANLPTVRSTVGLTIAYVTVCLVYFLLVVVGYARVFGKAGRSPWAAIVPIYNSYVVLRIVGRRGWWLLLFLIPLVNAVVGLVIDLDLARSFRRGWVFGVGLWLLPFVFLPILGFGSSQYVGPAALVDGQPLAPLSGDAGPA